MRNRALQLFFFVSLVCVLLINYAKLNLDMHAYWHNEIAHDTCFKKLRIPKVHQYDLRKNKLANVLVLDQSVLENTRANLEMATATREWSMNAKGFLSPNPSMDDLELYQAIPLMATVDRRPLTVRKQMLLNGHHKNGDVLGCAFQTNTLVTQLGYIDNRAFKKLEKQATCSFCFQFSSLEQAHSFLRDQNADEKDWTSSTKCIQGDVEIHARFARWQSGQFTDPSTGYPWSIDCTLPNGIPELTCRGLEGFYQSKNFSDDVQRMYLKTNFTLLRNFGGRKKISHAFHVLSSWPWEALRAHSNDRRFISSSLPKDRFDTSSLFVPDSAKEMRLAYIEGPNYDPLTYLEHSSLKSIQLHPDSPGGVHPRLLTNLIHLARITQNITRFIGFPDGLTQQTYSHLRRVLQIPLNELIPKNYDGLCNLFNNNEDFIPIEILSPKGSFPTCKPNLTLYDLLHKRNIQIKLVSLPTPAQAFSKMLCGGQYAYAYYMAARFSADYQALLYFDGDAMPLEGFNSTLSLKNVIFEQLFKKSVSNGSSCSGKRFRLFEQSAPPRISHDDVLQCVERLKNNATAWKEMVDNCNQALGHIISRSDSVLALNVHYADTQEEYAPKGVVNCEDELVPTDVAIEIHLTSKGRKPVCTCKTAKNS